MTTTKTDKWDRIAEHGRQLLAIFPDAQERDPVKLCKKLRRLEAKAHDIALRACNGPKFAPGEQENLIANVLAKVNALLGNTTVPVFINLDARGYALKIDDEWMREHNPKLPRDWGDYGVLAPEIK